MTRVMKDEYNWGKKTPPWMKYKTNMQMKAQCQMHGEKEAHC